MIPDIFQAVSGNSGLTSLIGSAPVRFFPFGEAPEKTVYPYATYSVVNGLPQNTMDGPPQIDDLGTQIDVWAETADSCLDVAEALRDALEPLGHMTSIGNMERDPDTKSYRIRMDFDFFTER